jgi:hypothetical protein
VAFPTLGDSGKTGSGGLKRCACHHEWGVGLTFPDQQGEVRVDCRYDATIGEGGSIVGIEETLNRHALGQQQVMPIEFEDNGSALLGQYETIAYYK